ncbi:5'-3 exoribonuclease [Suillus plorans]|uniref:5'-3' exoribonuclease 2 n=1 Tax=Suillus plorans TaxID=116603 RepID=A0A9P7ACZ5_9AGAM|nr:5'-3 exoribonuclease [Suillus plorans]KAG1786321.1 5'-3 exoribonuclease [Suillus plorans]
MGIPALFRWLSKKYPKIVSSVIEAEEEVLDAAGDPIKLSVDITQPNPNGEEFDSLYLDMNGIVHPCTHPEGKPAPETEEEMMLEIFKYTNRVVNMVRPRKLLFMAIDGVAPRAKMNEQRGRRFRTAQVAKDKAEAHKLAVAEWEAMGKIITDDEKKKESWDSNAITPGTPFMNLLTASLRYWVVEKMNADPGWKDLQVIISDASVPGEGEHKIMDFIRRQRTNPGHEPNTRHVIYGLDADFIMLALATHEPYFRVLREDVFARTKVPGAESLKSEIEKPPPPEKKPFIFLDIAILREYLESELNVNNTPFPFDLEQAIDDWVLLIFFVGNDFLPHLPSLEIREGAIDTLLRIWKMELPRMGGYLTNHGQLVLSRVQIILEGLARREDEISVSDKRLSNAKIRGETTPGDIQFAVPSAKLGLTASTTSLSSLPQRADNAFAAKADSIGLGAPRNAQSLEVAPVSAQALAGSNRDVVANRAAIRMANMSAAEMLKAELSGLIPVKQTDEPVTPVAGVKRKLEDIEGEDTDDVAGIDEESSEDNEDASYALKRYYQQKFGISENDNDFHYVEGIAWVLHYYCQGNPSWQWYYPYHFAPFASDFEGLENMQIDFTLGQPFKPYEQLMGVFPPASRKHIPEVFHDLMTNEESPIHDFYPSTFQIDMNGKKMSGKGLYGKRKEKEVCRQFDQSRFVTDYNTQPQPMPTNLSKGISGSVYQTPIVYLARHIKNDRCLSALYFFPKQLSPHRSMFLPGYKPARQLTGEDLARRGRGHGRGGGMDRGGRGRGGIRTALTTTDMGPQQGFGGYGSSGRHQFNYGMVILECPSLAWNATKPRWSSPWRPSRDGSSGYGGSTSLLTAHQPYGRGGYSGGYGGSSGGYGGQRTVVRGLRWQASRGGYGGSGGQDNSGSYMGYGNQNGGQARGGYGGGYNGGGYRTFEGPSRGF